MDMAREEVRNLNYNEFTETKSLDHATQQARQRNYQDFLIVDVDSHHYENEHYKEVYSYIESPVIKMEAMESIARGGRSAFLSTCANSWVPPATSANVCGPAPRYS